MGRPHGCCTRRSVRSSGSDSSSCSSSGCATCISTRPDRAWLGAIRQYVAHDHDRVPPAGKYNAGQKLFFWLQSLLAVVFVATGLPLWFPETFGAGLLNTMRPAALPRHAGRCAAADRPCLSGHARLSGHCARHDRRQGHQRLGAAASPTLVGRPGRVVPRRGFAPNPTRALVGPQRSGVRPRVAPRPAMRRSNKARRGSIQAVCDREPTPLVRMQRRSNAVGLSLRTASPTPGPRGAHCRAPAQLSFGCCHPGAVLRKPTLSVLHLLGYIPPMPRSQAVDPRWETRARRARALLPERPHAEPLLRFYLSLLELQAPLYDQADTTRWLPAVGETETDRSAPAAVGTASARRAVAAVVRVLPSGRRDRARAGRPRGARRVVGPVARHGPICCRRC